MQVTASMLTNLDAAIANLTAFLDEALAQAANRTVPAPDAEPLPELLTVKMVMAYLHCTRQYVYDRRSARDWTPLKNGLQWKSEVDAYLEGRWQPAPAKGEAKLRAV